MSSDHQKSQSLEQKPKKLGTHHYIWASQEDLLALLWSLGNVSNKSSKNSTSLLGNNINLKYSNTPGDFHLVIMILVLFKLQPWPPLPAVLSPFAACWRYATKEPRTPCSTPRDTCYYDHAWTSVHWTSPYVNFKQILVSSWRSRLQDQMTYNLSSNGRSTSSHAAFCHLGISGRPSSFSSWLVVQIFFNAFQLQHLRSCDKAVDVDGFGRGLHIRGRNGTKLREGRSSARDFQLITCLSNRSARVLSTKIQREHNQNPTSKNLPGLVLQGIAVQYIIGPVYRAYECCYGFGSEYVWTIVLLEDLRQGYQGFRGELVVS